MPKFRGGCGNEVPAKAKFCPECGSRVQQPGQGKGDVSGPRFEGVAVRSNVQQIGTVNIGHEGEKSPKPKVGNPEVYIELGEKAMANGHPEKAVGYYDQALALDPELKLAWFLHGEALFEMDANEEAVSSFDQALALDPDDPDLWMRRGDALFGSDDRADEGRDSYQEALTRLDARLAANPSDSDSWRLRGDALSVLESYQEALQNYDRALAIDPGDYAAAANQRSTLMRFEVAEQARAKAEQARAKEERIQELLGVAKTLLPTEPSRAAEIYQEVSVLYRRWASDPSVDPRKRKYLEEVASNYERQSQRLKNEL